MSDLDRMSLLTVEPERLRRAFVIQHGETLKFAEVLGERGIAFPEDYVLVRTLESPYTHLTVRVWVPRTRMAALRPTDADERPVAPER